MAGASQGRLHCSKCGKYERKPFEGLGTAAKPAHENWILIRKPLAEDTVAKNVVKHGTGALNIDGSRIGVKPFGNNDSKGSALMPNALGRFPANLVLSHNEGCVEMGTKKVKNNSGGISGLELSNPGLNTYGDYDRKSFTKYSDLDGTETISDFKCVDGCPIKILDEQSGTLLPRGRYKRIR